MLGKGEAVDVAHLDETKSLVRALEPDGARHGLERAQALGEPNFQSKQNAVIARLHRASAIHHQTTRGNFDSTAV